MITKIVFSFLVCFSGIASVASAASPDGTTWMVDTRSCAGAAISPTLNERLAFGDGTVTHTSIKTADAKNYCEEGLTYVRQVKSKSDMGSVYIEASMLVGQTRRMTCYSKTDNSIVSDTTTPLAPGRQTMTFQSMDDTAFTDIMGSSECPTGSLHLGLKK